MLRHFFLGSLLVSFGAIGVDIAVADTEKNSPSPSPTVSEVQPSSETPTQPPNPSSELSIDLNPNPNPLFLPTKPEEVKSVSIVPLTLEQAIELAQRNNRQLQIARLQLEGSRATLAEAQAALFPTLDFQVQGQRALDAGNELQVQAQRKQGNSNIRDAQTGVAILNNQIELLQGELAKPVDFSDPRQAQQRIAQISQLQLLQQQLQQTQQQSLSTQESVANLENFATTAINGTAQLNYAIYSPQRQASIDIAAEQVRFSELEVRRIEDQLRLDVALAYYDLQQADEDVRILESDVQDRQRRLEFIQIMLDAALATRLDLLNAQVDLDNSLQELRDSQARQQSARRNLAQFLQLPSSVTPKAADRVELRGTWNLSLEESIVLALKNRVELEQQLAQRRENEGRRALALAAIRPSVSLFASYSVLNLYSDDSSDFAARGLEDGYAFGLNFSWRLFDGGAASAGARRAEAGIAIAEQQFADNASLIRLQVEQAYFQLTPQLENVQTATESLGRAREALRAAQLRFDAGIDTQTEVLNAKVRLVRAENNLVRAKLSYNRALAQLERAVSFLNNPESKQPPSNE
jgi:OMF family outer membrane factor